MAENRRIVFLNQVLDSLRQRLPDASDADLLKAATRQMELEEASKAASAERRVSKAKQQAVEAKEGRKLDLEEQAAADARAQRVRAENPQGLVERIIGPKGSDRRESMRNLGYTALGGALTTGATGLINAATKGVEKSIDDALPPATAPSGKAPLTPSTGQVSDFINSIQKFNQNLRGQAIMLRLRFDFEGANRLEAQQIDPLKALQEYREGARADFGYGTIRKIEQETAGYEAEQELERIKQETERIKEEAANQRKVLDLAGEVIKSTEGSMNIDLLPSRR